MKQYDVITIGDAKIDIFLKFHKQTEDIHYDDCEVCMTLGAKIPIDHSYLALGGDATNAAVGLSRLGMRTAIMAETGNDDFAEKIIKDLKHERVSLEYLIETKGSTASFSIIFSISKERTIFSRHVKREHNFQFEDLSTHWIYLTALGEDWHEPYEKTIEIVKKNPIKLAFNPGSSQLKEGRESFMDVLSITDILFINKEEGERIAYKKESTIATTDEFMRALLHDVKKLGPKMVSITDGVKGSYLIDQRGQIFSQGILPSRVVEKTGVGDAYASAFLGALLHAKNNVEAMKWGAANSASVIEHIGATVGLLTPPELARRI